MEEQAPRRRRLQTHHWLMITFLVVALIAITAGAYYFNQYNSLNNILKNPNVAVEKQTKELVGLVSKLMVLPTDEQPTIATVTDAAKLKDQAFFKNAKNGDKVLIYVKARKAILYRQSSNMIVDVAPVNISQNQQQTVQPSGTLVEPTGVVVTVAPTVAPTTVVSPTPAK
ncbi:MAG TPA: hypothetical protein VEW42_06535 [Candidatus Eisenbacteria bacterium]|nr:hypothetical protein [Candidatus Eisenbacteria bacterium]